MGRKVFERATLVALATLSLAPFALPVACDVLWGVGLPLMFRWSRVPILITSFLLVAAALVINVASSNDNGRPDFYREHEKYAEGNRYRKSVNDTIVMQFGDLYALDGGRDVRREAIKEQRTVEFITDELGFRNNISPLSRSEIVLVGDSFIVANGTTQSEIPANVLSSLTGKSVSSLAYPDDPGDYERRMRSYLASLGENSVLYVFYFEGNDFLQVTTPPGIPAAEHLINTLRDLYWRTESGKEKFLSRLYSKNNMFVRTIRARTQLMLKRTLEPVSPVDYYVLGGRYVGFLKTYQSMAVANETTTHIFQDPIVLQKVKGIFFVPTKFRTYSKRLGANISNASLDYLRKSYSNLNIPVHDLTPGLQKEADKLLRDGRFVYWRDDTHWNGAGIAAAMKCVANFMQLYKPSERSPVCE